MTAAMITENLLQILQQYHLKRCFVVCDPAQNYVDNEQGNGWPKYLDSHTVNPPIPDTQS